MSRTRHFLLCAILLMGSGRIAGASVTSSEMLDCILPEVSYTFTGDCQAGEFYIDLEIISVGDSPSLTVEYDLFGFVETYTDVQPGVLQLGPFFEGEVLTLSIIHGVDPACDIVFTDVNPAGGCPFYLACGSPPVTVNYCYQDDQNTIWNFEGIGDGSLVLNFLSGQIGSGDTLTIYDGPDTNSPILFQHDDPTQIDLSGINIISSSPFMYITLNSNDAGSCASGLTELSWQIACLDCAFPDHTVTVVDDCANDQFSIELNIITTGDGSTVDVEYTVDNGPLQTMPGLGVGMIVLGPYALGQQIAITIGHETEILCDQQLGVFTDTGFCPTLVECGQPNVLESYCYEDNDSQFWIYEAVGNQGALYLEFTGGMIDAATGDSLRIYDGADTNAPLIFEHTGGLLDLTGIYMISNSGSLFVEMSSDGSNSCATNASWEWQWFVSCLNCFPPVATFELIQDCDNFQYYIDVNLSDLGSDPEVTITNTAGIPPVDVTAPGNVLVGPFVSGTFAQLTLVNDVNPICNVVSENFINPLCPTFICGSTPIVETFCYGPGTDTAWAYALPGAGQLRLVFNIGTIGTTGTTSPGDSLRIYDGQDAQAPLLFEHVNTATSELGPDGSAVEGPGNSYYAVDVVASGSNLYMELTSNNTGHCDGSGIYDPMVWEVSCEACVPPGVNYLLEPDCEHLSYNAMVEVINAPGASGLEVVEATSGETLIATQPGTFSFEGSFDLDSTVTFLLTDLDNAGCVYNSGPLLLSRDTCIIRGCGIDNYTLCYGNDDERWYTYQSEDNFPISITFLEGQMMPSDDITIYNGVHGLPGQAVIYQGNNGGNLAGITVNSSNLLNALTLRIRSNEQWSCEDGFVDVPIRWDVGCGFVGMNELGLAGFNMFPNPTNGSLTIQFAGAIEGPITLRVLDMSGRIVIERTVRDLPLGTLDLGDLQDGQYLMQITTNDHIATNTFQLIR